jgi:MerR family transcriptional regulator, copper efflux regulator
VRANAGTNRPLNSGELARLAGVSSDTLRYYERRRLIPPVPRSASGYRLFPPQTLNRVRLIRAALSIGFSVRELREIFRERDRGAAPCRRVRELAAEKLGAVEVRLRELRSCRSELRKTLAQWDRLLAKTPRGEQARLLEAFAATYPQSSPRRSSPLGVLARGRSKKEKQV